MERSRRSVPSSYSVVTLSICEAQALTFETQQACLTDFSGSWAAYAALLSFCLEKPFTKNNIHEC
jgi:hypothetical protein